MNDVRSFWKGEERKKGLKRGREKRSDGGRKPEERDRGKARIETSSI